MTTRTGPAATGPAGPAPAMGGWSGLDLATAAGLDPGGVLDRLDTTNAGLPAAEAARRRALVGPNAVRSHRAQAVAVLARQLRSPLLLLLAAAAAVSLGTGQRTDAVIILSIVGLSVGLGFVNEYRSERAVEALHESIRHRVLVLRGGRAESVDVTDIVPGDVVRLGVGDVVPADLRLLAVTGLECDEAVLTGESAPQAKTAAATAAVTAAATAAVTADAGTLDLPSCALMGTVVRSGSGRGVVVGTGSATAFGRIALSLGERPAETAFSRGLRDFSLLLVRVAGVLCLSIFVINTAFRRPLLEALLFSLAIAVGLTPQLLPAIVTISLSAGARTLARRKVVVKRLVSIEDLGNMEVLYTDKTGTLTEGRIEFAQALSPAGAPDRATLELGLVCHEAADEADRLPTNPLDRALREAPAAAAVDVSRWRRLGEVPFDYDRRLVSVLVEDPSGSRLLITKGAPESVLARCRVLPAEAPGVLEEQFAAGARVVAVASRDTHAAGVTAADEHDLTLRGLLVFADRVKPDVADSVARLDRLGVAVKVLTGDNELVARRLCGEVGIPVARSLTGARVAAMSDAELSAALPSTGVFARVSPEQKARILRLHRAQHVDVGFLGDGVNDAVALHEADTGISVDSATDVAKDAADIVLLDKDLGVLAEGVVEGRRIFANTVKYVLMGTSSNFGNMFSAAGASLFLSFLPMLPTQILLNNLLYDVGQLTLPADSVDEESLRRPAGWDVRFIRRFMAFFGPISSLFDFATFAVMLWVFDAGEELFHTGWFVESLATQTLVIYVIRTRRVPFLRSRPARPLLVTTLAVVLVGTLLPFTPLAGPLGFVALPANFLLVLCGFVVVYLGLVEVGKARFFAVRRRAPEPLAVSLPGAERRVHRRAARFSHRRARAAGGTQARRPRRPVLWGRRSSLPWPSR